MKALNYEDVNGKLSALIEDVTNGKIEVDIARLKQTDSFMKTLILNNSKKLIYNQFMKQAKPIKYFGDK